MNIGALGPSVQADKSNSQFETKTNPQILKTDQVANPIFGTATQNTSPISVNRASLPPAMQAYSAIALSKEEACEYRVNGNTLFFSPVKDSWELKLDGLQSYFSRISVSSALVFHHGKVDTERFISAFKRTLCHFDILFGHFTKNHETNETTVRYSKEKDCVSLELIEEDRPVDELTIEELIPVRSLEQMLMQFSEKDAIGSFRLTVLKDGFAIGYSLNHAFFDQSGIFYFMKFLSYMYSHDIPLARPALFSAANVLNEPAIAFTNNEQIRNFNELEIFYTTDKSAFLSRFASKTQEFISLRIPENRLEELAKSSPEFITANDLIHAIFCKVKAQESTAKGDEKLKLNYACNLRKAFGLGEEALGNILITGCFTISMKKCQKLSLINLAIKNRKNHSKLDSAATFNKALCWYDGLQNFKEDLGDYLFSSCLEPRSYIMSNWSSFKYSEIKFGEAMPTSLRAARMPNINASAVLFEIVDGKKYWLVPMEIGIGEFERIKQFGIEENLFELQN